MGSCPDTDIDPNKSLLLRLYCFINETLVKLLEKNIKLNKKWNCLLTFLFCTNCDTK